MKKSLLLLALVFLGRHAYADLSGGGLTDYFGNGVTSQAFSGARNALDVETVVGGSVIDPRTRTWTLLNTTDSVNAVQSGAWTTGRTWTLLNTTDSVNAVQSGTWTVLQGAPNSVPSAWPVKLTDGTNTMGVAPASTPSAVGQPSGVVALSPNSPLPVGTNIIGQVNQASGSNPWIVSGSGTSGTPATGVVTVQGISGGVKQPVTTGVGGSGTPTQTSISCGTSSTTLLAASAATWFIAIRNPTTATTTVWINIAGASAVAGAPSIDLPPGGEAEFTLSENSYLPTSQINCISGGAGASTLTLFYK